MYEILTDDGNGDIIKIKLSREKLCEMIGNTILRGVMSSMEIEGEGGIPLALKSPVNLPERILQTP